MKITVGITNLAIAVMMTTKFQTLLRLRWKTRTIKSFMRLSTVKRMGQMMIK